jgi:hypothetical protein
MSTAGLEFDHIGECKAWRKEQQLMRKAQDQAILSYIERFDIKSLCNGEMNVVHCAMKNLAELLEDEEFREKVFADAVSIAEQHPLVKRAPRRRKLRVELWADGDLKLKSALDGDGFRCVSAVGCSPQVYYGDGVPERYRNLVEQPDTVSLYVADGVVRGRVAADAGTLATAEPESPSTADVHPAGAVSRDGGPARRRSLRTVADRVAEAKVHDADAYEAPPVGSLLHLLVETAAADALLGAIIRREGAPDAPAILRHLRGSFKLGHITKTTRDKVQKRLDALCKTSAFAIDQQGRYRALKPTVDPAPSPGADAREGSRSDAGVSGAGGEREDAPGLTADGARAAAEKDPPGLGSATSESTVVNGAGHSDDDAPERRPPGGAPSPNGADR